jgi:hypothetical protein
VAATDDDLRVASRFDGILLVDDAGFGPPRPRGAAAEVVRTGSRR